MIDLLLRFEDETAAVAALHQYRAQSHDAAPAWVLASPTHALDVIGPVELVPAVIDKETGEIVAPAIRDGRFHMNLRMLVDAPPAGLGLYIVNPKHPARVWA